MEPRYSRNIPSLTEQECAFLRKKRIAVIGCGGLGGYLIELMARLGIGFIRAVDGDVFEASNLNRQLFCEMPLLGTRKAEAAAERVRRINPDVEVEALPVFLDAENASRLIAGSDAVLDALDSISARRLLAKACAEAGIPYIYGAVSGWVAQAAVSMPGDNLIETLYPPGCAPKDKSVLSFTPALCASMQAALCAKLLTGQTVTNGHVYCFDLFHQEFECIPLLRTQER